MVIAESTVHVLPASKRTGNYDLEGWTPSIIHAFVDDDQIEKLLKNIPGFTTLDIAKILHIL